MRIIEWNCQGAFRKKNEEILNLNPDILIIPECESPEKLQFGKLTPKPNDSFWYSDNGKKGIGIFSFSDFKFELLKEFNPKFRYIIPLKVTGNNGSFLLFAIWAMDNKENKAARYIGQIWLAINYYERLLNLDSILVGDYNSNQIWDEKERVGNHTDVVNKLKEYGILSLYHEQNKVAHGQEKEHTFFMYRKLEKPYHIDYCFASQCFIQNGYKIKLGEPNQWISISDHVPLIIETCEPNKRLEFKNSLADYIDFNFKRLDKSTREKYQNTIIGLEKRAKESDRLNFNKESQKIRKEIIEDTERLNIINKLTIELNKNVG